jgi:hypothetical protein
MGIQQLDYLPWKAFDGDNYTYWATSGGGVNGSLTIYLGDQYVVTRLYLTTNPAGTEYATNWTVYGSNDGNTFTAIQTFAVNSVGYFNLLIILRIVITELEVTP